MRVLQGQNSPPSHNQPQQSLVKLTPTHEMSLSEKERRIDNVMFLKMQTIANAQNAMSNKAVANVAACGVGDE